MYTFANGNVYRGQYKGGKREGDGVFTWADGNVYRGQWKGDKIEGDGVHTWANGNVYRGQWQGGLREGDGVFTIASGRRTFGQCKGGKQVSSVPFDTANPAHAALLRAANEAEARRVGAPHSASGAIGPLVARCRLRRTPPTHGRKLRRCASCRTRLACQVACSLECEGWHPQAGADEASEAAAAAEAKFKVASPVPSNPSVAPVCSRPCCTCSTSAQPRGLIPFRAPRKRPRRQRRPQRRRLEQRRQVSLSRRRRRRRLMLNRSRRRRRR